MKTSADDWSFECKTFGRDGYFFYHEGSRELPFYWELGGGDVVGIVRIDEPTKFGLKFPWAVERSREIFARVAQELIRQSPDCTTEIDHERLCIYVKRPAA
jgi:hypothetical protein